MFTYMMVEIVYILAYYNWCMFCGNYGNLGLRILLWFHNYFILFRIISSISFFSTLDISMDTFHNKFEFHLSFLWFSFLPICVWLLFRSLFFEWLYWWNSEITLRKWLYGEKNVRRLNKINSIECKNLRVIIDLYSTMMNDFIITIVFAEVRSSFYARLK